MAGVKISALTQATAIDETADEFVIVQAGSSKAAVGRLLFALLAPMTQGFRLSVVTATPVPTTDQVAKSTVYLTPTTSGQIALYTGVYWKPCITAEVSIALSGLTSGKNYDVFAYNNAGTVTLELSAAWTNDTTRADARALQDGVLVKSADHTRRYIGTIRATGVTTTEDSAAKRFVWNAYNPARRHLKTTDTTGSWAGAAAAWRQTRGTAANCFEYVCGDAVMIEVIAQLLSQGSGSGAACSTGIGIDVTATNSADLFGKTTEVAGVGSDAAVANYRGSPAAGYHKVNWLEYGNNTVTFFGQTSDFSQSGMIGSVQG